MTINEKVHTENEDYDMSDSADGVVLKQGDIEMLTAEATGMERETIKHVINAVWDEICDALEAGDSIQLHGKGRIYLSKRSSRIGRNPLTGEEYEVPAREAMAWQTSPAYAKRLRERRDKINKMK